MRKTLSLAILLAAWALGFGSDASAASSGSDAAVISAILAPQSGAALAAVKSVRAQSRLSSTLPEAQLDDHLARLLEWTVNAYAQSGNLHLLADAPDARNGRGLVNARLRVLQQTYWLQDNALYGERAFDEYAPALGKTLADSWRTKWNQTFPRLCPVTQSSYVVGIVPPYDSSGSVAEPRCRLTRPGPWQFFHMTQYPDPKQADFETRQFPIIGTDHPVDAANQTHLAPIQSTSVRDLLKYGCLRQADLGNIGLARQMFGLALAQWDGNGFKNAKNEFGQLVGIYWTRDLTFALLCANAIGAGAQNDWGQGVTKSAIEQKLWASQSPSGGIWTNYCEGANCADGFTPSIAKQTNEIAPLVLLAYGPNIWKPAH